MTRVSRPTSRSVNPKDDARIAQQRSMGMVTQSDQDKRISRLESIAQRQEKPWQFINMPWYYREIPIGTSAFLNPNFAVPTAASTFAGITGRDFVSPVSGYIAGAHLVLSKEMTAGSVAIVARKYINASLGINHVLEESRISFGDDYLVGSSYILENPEAGVPIGRGERWRPGFTTDTLSWSGATTMVGQVFLVIAFKV